MRSKPNKLLFLAKNRLFILGGGITLLFGVLAARFYELQIKSKSYSLREYREAKKCIKTAFRTNRMGFNTF